jgi:hypothetical protein
MVFYLRCPERPLLELVQQQMGIGVLLRLLDMVIYVIDMRQIVGAGTAIAHLPDLYMEWEYGQQGSHWMGISL